MALADDEQSLVGHCLSPNGPSSIDMNTNTTFSLAAAAANNDSSRFPLEKQQLLMWECWKKNPVMIP